MTTSNAIIENAINENLPSGPHLCAQQDRSGDRKDPTANALVRPVDDHQIGDAQQRNKYQQCLGCLPVLPRFDRIGRSELGDENLTNR